MSQRPKTEQPKSEQNDLPFPDEGCTSKRPKKETKLFGFQTFY